MAITINGTTGIAGVDGSAGTPAVQGADTNTGVFYPAADTVGVSTGGSERMRVDSSGNVGIGTSSPATRLNVSYDVAGNTPYLDAGTTVLITNVNATGSAGIKLKSGATAYPSYITYDVNSGSSAALVFYDRGANAERMRIDSSGNLLVGNSAQIWDERLSARNSTSAVVAGFYAQSTSYTSSVIRAQAETAAGTGWYLFEGRASTGSFQYGIRGNGTVATSDERRKKNIEPARSYLQDVCSIPVVKYNWKSDEDDTPKELGWLAQDVEKVFPNMVVTHHDGPNDDQEVLLLKKEVFLPMLMKCIQEQQVLIQQLQADVAALKGTS